MIVLFLTGMVAMIMMRTLHKDITRYNEDPADDAQEEFGWKLVHGDVFRPPQTSPMLLSVLVGSGVQILAMTLPLMVFALLGFLSPANRGGLTTAMLLLFVFMGYFAGLVSSRFYKLFGGKQWKHNTVLIAVFYPGIAFCIFFVVNLFVWHSGSSGAVPFSTMFTLLLLWFGISFPLAALGCVKGFKMDTLKVPARYNQIPRQIPEQPFYMTPLISCLVAGVLPFGAVFIELFFIMSSIWLHQVYYVFGFLSLVLLILVITCAEITIVLCYFQLCSEDYHWWWRSFFTSGSSAVYLFLYAILYFNTRLELRPTAAIIYFSYMLLISFSFFLLSGSIGFLACFWFNKLIFSSIKID
jgi:transmembrane 9 superfamily protein 2/4